MAMLSELSGRMPLPMAGHTGDTVAVGARILPNMAISVNWGPVRGCPDNTSWGLCICTYIHIYLKPLIFGNSHILVSHSKCGDSILYIEYTSKKCWQLLGFCFIPLRVPILPPTAGRKNEPFTRELLRRHRKCRQSRHWPAQQGAHGPNPCHDGTSSPRKHKPVVLSAGLRTPPVPQQPVQTLKSGVAEHPQISLKQRVPF